MFVGLFPRKKDEMPAGNLWKLVEACDTIEEPVLVMKLISVKRGIEGTIALTQSHGEEVDWEKVGSSYACPPMEMKEFLKKVKGCVPKLVSLILPAPTPLITAPGTSVPSSSMPAPGASAPSSSTPAPTDPAAAAEVV
jgi:hypothetical protein